MIKFVFSLFANQRINFIQKPDRQPILMFDSFFRSHLFNYTELYEFEVQKLSWKFMLMKLVKYILYRLYQSLDIRYRVLLAATIHQN